MRSAADIVCFCLKELNSSSKRLTQRAIAGAFGDALAALYE
jgi:hypothetical protein